MNDKKYLLLGVFFVAVIVVFSFNGWGAKLLASLVGVSGNKQAETQKEDTLYYQYPVFQNDGQVGEAAVRQIKTSFDRNGNPEPLVQIGSELFAKSVLAALPPVNAYGGPPAGSLSKNYAVRVYYSGGAPNAVMFYKNGLAEISMSPGNNNNATVLYLPEPGPWSIHGVWTGDEDGIVKHVIKNGLEPGQAGEPAVSFTLNKSDAKNTLTFNLTKPSGEIFHYAPPLFYKFSERASGHGFNVIVPAGVPGNQIKIKVSDVGADYNLSGVVSYGEGDNLAVHLYQLNQGIMGDKNLSNSAGDFVAKDFISFDSRFSKQKKYGFIGNCAADYNSLGAGGYSCAYFSSPSVSLSANSVKKVFVFNGNFADITASPYLDYPSFNFLLSLDGAKSFFDKNVGKSPQYYVSGNNVYNSSAGDFNFLASRAEKSFSPAFYAGSGLVFDGSRWQNFADKTINLLNGYSDQWSMKGSVYAPAAASYSLKKGAAEVLKGNLKFGENMISSLAAGNYEFRMQKETVINDLTVKTETISTFKIAAGANSIDENPPALTGLSINADGFLQNAVDTTLNNILIFGLDPVPGLTKSGFLADSLAAVKLEIITDGVNWRERPLTDLAGGKWSAVVNVPGDPTPAGALYSFRISAKDTAGNTFSYVFGIPTGLGLKDSQAPSVSITSPLSEAVFAGNSNIKVEAADNTDIVRVEIYLGEKLVATKISPPFNFSFDTKTAADGSYVLSAKAYDSAGNVGVSETKKITIDNTPPVAVIDAPSDGSIVGGTIVNIFGGATDNAKINKVEFFLDGGTPLGFDDTFPYILSWDSTTVPDGKHVISSKVSDTAGNVSAAKELTVYVENKHRGSPSISTSPSAPTIKPPSFNPSSSQ